ncbi:Ig-like domain-containing protein [Actinoplanes xinjiangensis]|uniref:Ig-like domain-containing protein n=1 Tax=Actinoplanes xinjiangensis TaxID=512350 RepID=UPI00130ED51D|nr:Ig-like domain-containing protein [Actinoplanes xinjiangensis]
MKHTGLVTVAALAASLVSAPPAFAAGVAPKVYARTAGHWVGGVTPVTFETQPSEDLSAVTGLTVYAGGREIGTDTAAPWGIDWDTTGFDGLVTLTTRATTADGSLTTGGFTVHVDNRAPTGLTVRFPRKDGYIGQGGELAVDAADNVYVIGSELIVGGQTIASKDLMGGGNLDLRWNVKVPNGRTPMTVRVRDQAGNVTAVTRTVTVDNDRPVITGRTSAGRAVRGDFTVSLSGYRDASPFASFEASLNTPRHLRSYAQENSRTVTIRSREVPDGWYTLGWHAVDAAGNETVLKRSLLVDNRVPSVWITKAPRNRAKVTRTFTVTAAASDTYGIAKVQLLINGKVVRTDTTAGYTFAINPKKYGKKFTMRFRTYDRAGNVRYTTSRTYQR